MGDNQKKILLLLVGGVALSFSRSPKGYFKIIKSLKNNWRDINEDALKRSVKNLYESKLIKEKENKDGSITLVLTDKGKERSLRFNLENLSIKVPQKWDKKWRIVIFDVPEKNKKGREALRYYLKKMGFEELQKSVFVHPFQCENEVEYVIEYFNIRKFVRFIEAVRIDNEAHLKIKFDLK